MAPMMWPFEFASGGNSELSLDLTKCVTTQYGEKFCPDKTQTVDSTKYFQPSQTGWGGAGGIVCLDTHGNLDCEVEPEPAAQPEPQPEPQSVGTCCGTGCPTSGCSACDSVACYHSGLSQPPTACLLQLNTMLRSGSCDRHGICDGNSCECFQGWSGTSCETQVATKGSCCSQCKGSGQASPGWDCSGAGGPLSGGCVCNTNQLNNIPACCMDGSACNHAC